jgi:hypothetical protein
MSSNIVARITETFSLTADVCLQLTGLSHAPLSPGFFTFGNFAAGECKSLRSAVPKKIPTHRREQNVMRNNRALKNIGA